MTLKIIPILITILVTGCTSNKKAENGNDFYKYLNTLEELKIESTITFNSENTSLTTPLKLVADDIGNLIVANHTTWSLHYLSPNSDLIDKKGGIGKGPGEFSLINDLTIGCDDTLFVLDKRLKKVSVFSMSEDSLLHINDLLLSNYSPLRLESFYNCKNQEKYGVLKNYHSKSEGFNSVTVYELDDELQLKEKIIDLKSNEVMKFGGEVEDNVFGFKNYWDFHDGKLYYTYSNSFNVHVLELSGRTKHSISTSEIPSFDMNEEQKSAILDRFGPYLSATPGLEDEINNREALPYFHSYTSNESYSYFTVFNIGFRDGVILRLNHETQELKKIESPKLFQLFDVKGNKLYGIQNTEEGGQSVVVITLEE